jgi:hypothetical protein
MNGAPDLLWLVEEDKGNCNGKGKGEYRDSLCCGALPPSVEMILAGQKTGGQESDDRMPETTLVREEGDDRAPRQATANWRVVLQACRRSYFLLGGSNFDWEKVSLNVYRFPCRDCSRWAYNCRA